MSQSSWQIGRPDLNAVFLNFFFFPEQQTCQIWVGHSFEIWNLIFGWARYKTEHRVEEVCCSKCFIVFVISFLVYFDKKVHKKLKKKISKQKNSNLGFCWIKRAPKNKCARQLWDIWFIFFSLNDITTPLLFWLTPFPFPRLQKSHYVHAGEISWVTFRFCIGVVSVVRIWKLIINI